MSDMTGSAWPDETDEAILDQLRELHDAADAPPADLADRVLFALSMAGLDAEVARLQADQPVGSGARATERTRTVSFDAESLTIMVTVVEMPDGRMRIDGWLAPAQPLRVELRLRGERAGATTSSQIVRADDGGRFVFPAVGHGLAQFVVHRDSTAQPTAGPSTAAPSTADPSAADLSSTVVTPSMTL